MRDAYFRRLPEGDRDAASVVATKLRELDDRIARVREHLPADVSMLAADRSALDLVSFNLMLAVQVCLDIASHVIADEAWPPAASLGEAFQRLRGHGVITTATSSALRRAAGLRNVVAHGYAEAHPDLLYAAAKDGLPDQQNFASEVRSWGE